MSNEEKNPKEKMRECWEEVDMDIDTECTCNDCGIAYYCKFSYDLYNCGGDCLRDK